MSLRSTEAQELLLKNQTNPLPLVLQAAAILEAAYRLDSPLCLVKD